VYVDVETDEPMFGTVKEGFISRHLTFVPLLGAELGPDSILVDAPSEKRGAAQVSMRERKYEASSGTDGRPRVYARPTIGVERRRRDNQEGEKCF
jgi:hypothetical protein